jgi:hypothetical protein
MLLKENWAKSEKNGPLNCSNGFNFVISGDSIIVDPDKASLYFNFIRITSQFI